MTCFPKAEAKDRPGTVQFGGMSMYMEAGEHVSLLASGNQYAYVCGCKNEYVFKTFWV